MQQVLPEGSPQQAMEDAYSSDAARIGLEVYKEMQAGEGVMYGQLCNDTCEIAEKMAIVKLPGSSGAAATSALVLASTQSDAVSPGLMLCMLHLWGYPQGHTFQTRNVLSTTLCHRGVC